MGFSYPPDDCKVVELGVLTLNKVMPNSLEAEKKLLFLPTKLTAGIELSDDPPPSVRAAAYGVSFGRRSQPSSASSGPDNMDGHTSDTATQPSTGSP
jgi:catalase